MKNKDITVVICAAGMGTRLGIGTTKALVHVCGKPLIIRQLELLNDYDDVRIVLGYQADKVMEVVNKYRKDIMFAFNYDYANNHTDYVILKMFHHSYDIIFPIVLIGE